MARWWELWAIRKKKRRVRGSKLDPKDLLEQDDIIEPEPLVQLFPDLESLDRQKLYVYRILRRTRAGYEDMDVFENIVLVLNDINPSVDSMEGTTPEQIWKAIGIITEIYPDVEFSHEIIMYIKMMCNEAGCYFYPENLGLDNEYISSIKKLAANGPFPLNEDFLGVQASKYLKIVNYLGE